MYSESEPLVLAAANQFSYRVNITNTATDDGISPSLIVHLPAGVLYEGSVSVTI